MRSVVCLFVSLFAFSAFAADAPKAPAPAPAAAKEKGPAKVCTTLDKEWGFVACEVAGAACLGLKGAGLNCWLKNPGPAPSGAPAPEAKKK